MAGRTRKFNPVLSEQDKATLEKIVSSRTEEIRKVQRAKMILLAASGSSNTDIDLCSHSHSCYWRISVAGQHLI